MAIEKVSYLTLTEAIKFHILYMRKIGETRIGVFDRNLVESALARPLASAAYEDGDLIRQAATLSDLSKIILGKAETSAPPHC